MAFVTNDEAKEKVLIVTIVETRVYQVCVYGTPVDMSNKEELEKYIMAAHYAGKTQCLQKHSFMSYVDPTKTPETKAMDPLGA